MELWQLDKILFIDIETVSEYKSLEEVEEAKQKLWEHKAKFLANNNETSSELYESRASIYAEFGKIICIGFGYFKNENEQLIFKVKAFEENDEKALLQSFHTMIMQYFNDSRKYVFCGHNIKEFDLPYICRRMLIHGLPVPDVMETRNKKAYEIAHIDTMQLWKFGDYKNFTSLDLLANVLQVPSSKNDISGADVGSVYWLENNIKRIVEYCQRDVVTTARVYQRLCSLPMIQDSQVQYVTN